MISQDNDALIPRVQPAFENPDPVTWSTSYATYIKMNCAIKSFKSRFNINWLKGNQPIDFLNRR